MTNSLPGQTTVTSQYIYMPLAITEVIDGMLEPKIPTVTEHHECIIGHP